jgi:hypothetical protein
MNRYSSHAPKIKLLSNGAVFVLCPCTFFGTMQKRFRLSSIAVSRQENPEVVNLATAGLKFC